MSKWLVILFLFSAVAATFSLGAEEPADPRIAEIDALGHQYAKAAREGDYRGAAGLALKAAAKTKEVYGANSEIFASQLLNCAFLVEKSGEKDQAERLYKRTLQLFEKVSGVNDVKTAQVLFAMGEMYLGTDKPDLAAPPLQRALEIRAAALGENHQETLACVENLAIAYYRTGDYTKSEPMYERGLAIRHKLLGKDHLDCAISLRGMSRCYEALGQIAIAIAYAQECLELCEKKLDAEDPMVAASLIQLGNLEKARFNLPDAETHYNRALAILTKIHGKDSAKTVPLLTQIAQLKMLNGDFAGAQDLLLKCLKINLEAFGPETPEAEFSVSAAAKFYVFMGDHEAAEPMLQKCLEYRKKLYGPEDARTLNVMRDLARVCSDTGKWSSALEYTGIVLRATHKEAFLTLPGLTTFEQPMYFRRQIQPDMDLAFGLGLHAGTLAALAPASAEWVLNHKSLIHEALCYRARYVQTQLPRVAQLNAKLAALRQGIASQAQGTFSPEQEQELITILQWKRKDLKDINLYDYVQIAEMDLSRAVGMEKRDVAWFKLDDLRKNLPKDGVLVHWVRFSPPAAGELDVPPRYAAWVIHPAGKGGEQGVSVADLGAATEIDRAILDFREKADVFGANPPKSEEATDLLAPIAAKVLAPIEKEIAGYRHWILSPDSAVWLVPFAALPDAAGKAVVEGHAVSYLTSGRELFAPAETSNQAPVVMADPDYDMGLKKPAENEPLVYAITRATSRGRQHWDRLKGSKDEAEALRRPLEELAKMKPLIWTGQAASEPAFKALQAPRILVMSTHGFFEPDDDDSADLRGKEKRGIASYESTLLRCGLVLAGANNHRQLSGGDDGILTGLEIVNANLRGTELVVLSACDSGVGRVGVSEGVVGLRQCFQLAGAGGVLASLWKVPDRSTAELMSRFFENISAGQDKAEALRSAQLAIRAKPGRAHMFYWAAFTLTGKWR